MSEAAFQSAFVRLISDPAFRDRLRRATPPVEDLEGLSAGEAEGLTKLALSPGIDAMRKLHLGFRLNKLFSMLPLTCRLLGDKRMASEAAKFWRQKASASFYFLEEAEAFAEYLSERLSAGLCVPYLGDVLAYESALLILRHPRSPGTPAPVVSVEFRHDPQLLLTALQRDESPRAIPRRRTRLLGSVDETGEARWMPA